MNAPFSQPERRREWLEAARQIFLQQGFEANMEQVAQAMGIAKQTLYNHFVSKEQLFFQVVQEIARSFLVVLEEDHGSLRQNLIQFAHSFRRQILSDEGMQLYRLVMCAQGRFPELAEKFFQAGPGHTRQVICQVMANAMHKGELGQENAQFVADMFLSMLSGFERTERLLGGRPLAMEEEIEHIEHIVDRFLTAFRP